MGSDLLVRSIDLLFTSQGAEVTLVFFGGEPLERPDLVREAVALAERRALGSGKRVRYALATNGLRLDDDTLGIFPAERLQVFLNLACGQDVAARRSALLRQAGVWHCVNVVVAPSDLGTVHATMNTLAAAGVPRVEIFFRVGIEWSEDEASRFLQEIGDLIARKSPPLLMNAAEPIAPFLLHNDAVVDCDGNVYWSAAIYLEESFPALKRACHLGRIDEMSTLGEIWSAPDDIRHILLQTYPPESSWGRILRNNLQLGGRFFELCGHRHGGYLSDDPPRPGPQRDAQDHGDRERER
jgi:hypothetical protein